MAATNRDLVSAVQEGRFREDLYHRLNVILISLPSLRDRREDIPELCDYYLRRYSAEAKRHFRGIASEALERLTVYGWPGNVRELANAIEQAVVPGSGPMVTVADLPERILSNSSRKRTEALPYRSAVYHFRKEPVERALGETGGNRVAAAKALGLHEKSLIRLIRALRIN